MGFFSWEMVLYDKKVCVWKQKYTKIPQHLASRFPKAKNSYRDQSKAFRTIRASSKNLLNQLLHLSLPDETPLLEPKQVFPPLQKSIVLKVETKQTKKNCWKSEKQCKLWEEIKVEKNAESRFDLILFMENVRNQKYFNIICGHLSKV